MPAPDERFPGRHQMTLAFVLPRGSYATLVLAALWRASTPERCSVDTAR
jgi:tRNA(Glu) U13 pseudouridine synthase TruD